MKSVFIAGCPRSGTNLMLRMFYAFEKTVVHDVEVPLERLAAQSINYPNKVFVGKYGFGYVFGAGTHVSDIKAWRDAKLMQSIGTSVVYMLRDGRDVLESGMKRIEHPVVPADWYRSLHMVEKYESMVPITIVKYRDLINHPDEVQERVRAAIGLTPKHKFSEYPDFVPPHINQMWKNPRYKLRPLTREHIGKPASRKILNQLSAEDRMEMDRLLEKYGYVPSLPDTER